MPKIVLGFPRTIYQVREEEIPELKGKFLDPWSSLKPAFLRKRIANEIIALFVRKKNKLEFEPFFHLKNGLIDPSQITNHWALVFPKRSYLPWQYPHLQLWYLTNHFVPSLKFMSDEEIKTLSKITLLIKDIFVNFSKKMQGGNFCFGYNATPFSFIRDPEGQYYAGGQSVRVFHAHFLLMPPESQMKKIAIDEKESFLIYPTDFSKKLFKLIFGAPTIAKKVFQDTKFVFDERGVVARIGDDYQRLWFLLKKIDEIFYQIQLILIYAFYQDGEKFIFQIEKFITTQNIASVEKRLGELILVGKERSLSEIKAYIVEGLERFAKHNQVKFSKKDIDDLLETLFLDENGDLSSNVFGAPTVLRPGMGYGCLAKLSRNKLDVKITPLDVLGSKGLMEASGYWFERKIEVDQFPQWLNLIAQELVSKLKK